MNKKRLCFIALFVLAFLLTSCSKVTVSEENSPQLKDVSIISFNEGSESSQFVEVDLIFDREIAVVSDTAKSLRITIAGNRVQEGEYTLEADEDTCKAKLLISVEAITEGVLRIEKSEKADVISDIQDAGRTCAVMDFEVEGMIPSGVSLETIKTEPGTVVKQVTGVWNIRSIAWVGLTENGVLVPVSETRTLEMLDGYAAVHGHEFLMEDEEDIAEKIVEVLEHNYGSEYRFSCNGSEITAVKNGGDSPLDIVIYEYILVNGEAVKNQEEGAAHEHGSEEGSVVKATEADRDVTSEEQKFLQNLHTATIGQEGITDGKELYQTMVITGNAMPEEQIYSVKDLEELLRISFENQNMYEIGLPLEMDNYIGMDFTTFLRLCGVSSEKGLHVLCEDMDGKETQFSWDDWQEDGTTVLLALGSKEGPLTQNSEMGGPMSLMVQTKEKVTWIKSLSKVTIGTGKVPEDPEYGYHNREPHLQGKDATFTVEIYQKGAEYLGAVKTCAFTTEEIENLMKEHPEAVVRNYYGTIGNMEVFSYMGVGGWLDCFEGIDFRWLLTEQVGLDSWEGTAELIGRDGEVYSTIDDLSYLAETDKTSEYYVLTSEGVRIPDAIPMIACIKNGYPILPEHDHESSGYVAYNQLNQKLEQAGIGTEVGVVKNHNGPFVACFGNRDGFYGGNQIETGGDCILIRLYVNEK